jgi:hypothetical protein
MKQGIRAERRAAPKPARLAMCLRLNAASIAVPLGDRPGTPAFSGAGLGEGHFQTDTMVRASANSAKASAGSGRLNR